MPIALNLILDGDNGLGIIGKLNSIRYTVADEETLKRLTGLK